MSNPPRIGSPKFQQFGRGRQIEALPERKVVTYRDFRRGYTPSEQRQMVNEAASPDAHDMEIRDDNRIWRAPGTEFMEGFPTRPPSRLALHPSLGGTVQLAFYSPPFIGFRGSEHTTLWWDLGMQDREFASVTFGGTFIFTDGVRVWARPSHNSQIKELGQAVPAATYASMAGRIFAGRTLIGGRWEPLGIRWTSADSDYRNWEGLGAGFELLINDISTGDRIQKLQPMSLDFMAVMMRHSIWVGRFTGQTLRPLDFGSSARTTGVGAVNGRVVALSRFGVLFLSDYGVYIFDGNSAELVSKDINGELLPLDYARLSEYHATYDPMRKRYILSTPRGITWIFELEHARWTQRKFDSVDASLFPDQADPLRWFEALGDWAGQGEVRWMDLAGENIGEIELVMLGNQTDIEDVEHRVLVKESRNTASYFGVPFTPYWETKLHDEQDAARLVTNTKQLVEYEGKGCLRIYLPEEDNQYVRVLEAHLAQRDYPSTAIFNAQKVGKGTGIGIEFCAGNPEPMNPPPIEAPPQEGPTGPPLEPSIPPPPTPDWTGFSIFSDVHACTPPEDRQQMAPLQIACFTWCNDAVCGGEGGFLIWYSNDPEKITQGCSHPDNPIPGMLS